MQQYYPIQQALDTQLLTVDGVTQWSSSNTTGNFFPENAGFTQAYFNNPASSLVYVRSTLIPLSPQTSTVGVNGYDLISGFYAIDVMGQLDKGYAATKQLADLIIAAFPRGTQFTLSNTDSITIEKTGMAQNINQGAWRMNKLYCIQVRVDWFGYMAPN